MMVHNVLRFALAIEINGMRDNVKNTYHYYLCYRSKAAE